MRHRPSDYSPTQKAPAPTQIPDEAMEVIADVLLQSAGKNTDQPAFTEGQLERKRRRAWRAEECFTATVAAGHALPDESDSLFKQAGLTHDEQRVWEMYSAGYRISEIARVLHVTRSAVRSLLRRGARRISACEFALRGLGDIYYREVHRPIYHRPRHCAARPCRRLGYCKFALGTAPET